MAKKKAASKKSSSRSAKTAASSKATPRKASSKKTTKKVAKTTTKKVAKKATTKKVAASASKKTAAKKTTAKKTAASKSTSKKTASKATATKSTKQPTEPKKAPAPAAEKASASKQTAKGAPAKKPDPASKSTDAKPNRKGITIVENRPKKKQAAAKYQPPPSTLGSLLNKRKRQPLIPSGPNAPTSEFSTFGDDASGSGKTKKVKSPFKKKELDKFREILLLKRRELAGDVEEMERGMASLGDRGGDPALDVAEQGSDAYDQSLSIGLAEADRKLIREIDAAVKRIDDGVYGICEQTHKPIGVERLKELPWTRLSIEAARDAERRGGPR